MVFSIQDSSHYKKTLWDCSQRVKGNDDSKKSRITFSKDLLSLEVDETIWTSTCRSLTLAISLQVKHSLRRVPLRYEQLIGYLVMKHQGHGGFSHVNQHTYHNHLPLIPQLKPIQKLLYQGLDLPFGSCEDALVILYTHHLIPSE